MGNKKTWNVVDPRVRLHIAELHSDGAVVGHTTVVNLVQTLGADRTILLQLTAEEAMDLAMDLINASRASAKRNAEYRAMAEHEHEWVPQYDSHGALMGYRCGVCGAYKPD